MTHVAFRVLRRRRETTLKNLNLVFGKEKSQDEILQIYRSTIHNIGKLVMECVTISRFNDSFYEKMVRIEGLENLNDALSLGRGVILLSAHFGSFHFLWFKLIHMGYPLSAIARYPRQKGLARYYDSESEKLGFTLIRDKPRRTCIEQSLKWLKRNGIVFVMLDLNVRKGGVYVDFFGKMVPTFKGPLLLNAESGAPIVPMFAVREDKGKHTILIDRPIELEQSGDSDRDVFLNLTKMSKIIESYVRQYPDQWWWVHQRWRKAKPKE